MTTTTTDVSTISSLTHDEAMRLQAAELERTLTLLRGLDTHPMGRRRRTVRPGTSARCTSTSSARARPVRRCVRTSTSCARGTPTARRTGDRSRLRCPASRCANGPSSRRRRSSNDSPQSRPRPCAVVGAFPGSCATTRSSRSTVRCTRRGSSATSSTRSTCATRGCTASTPRMRSASPSSSAPTTTAASSRTSSASGLADTASRSSLELTGPAGGSYAQQADAAGVERLSLDAVEFCRTLAGRVPATGLLAVVVPF